MKEQTVLPGFVKFVTTCKQIMSFHFKAGFYVTAQSIYIRDTLTVSTIARIKLSGAKFLESNIRYSNDKFKIHV